VLQHLQQREGRDVDLLSGVHLRRVAWLSTLTAPSALLHHPLHLFHPVCVTHTGAGDCSARVCVKASTRYKQFVKPLSVSTSVPVLHSVAKCGSWTAGIRTISASIRSFAAWGMAKRCKMTRRIGFPWATLQGFQRFRPPKRPMEK
jgi:hypothetical protein